MTGHIKYTLFYHIFKVNIFPLLVQLYVKVKIMALNRL